MIKGFGQATEQVAQILQYCVVPKSTTEIMRHLGLSHREHFRSKILLPLIKQGRLILTIPEKPNSSKQKYITVKNK